MKPLRSLLAVLLATAFGAAQAQAPADADARYVKRIDARYSSFAGSTANLESLAAGLRQGTQIRLTGSGETALVQPPTRPMGYGNITRTLDLSSRQLAALGITDPTPQEISAALNGGTVHTATGDVTLQGVLQLRSDGMGWGQIAHAIGVHPGMGSAKLAPAPVSAPAPAASASGITTAAGHAVVRPGPGAGQGPKSASAANRGGSVTSAAGGGAAPGLAKGSGNANGHAKGAGRI